MHATIMMTGSSYKVKPSQGCQFSGPGLVLQKMQESLTQWANLLGVVGVNFYDFFTIVGGSPKSIWLLHMLLFCTLT